MKMNYYTISLSLLISFCMRAMDSSNGQSSLPIAIPGAVVRSNDKVGSPLLTRTPLRYSRSELESFEPQTDKGKEENQKFVQKISHEIAALEAAVEAVKSLQASQQRHDRKGLTQSTP